MTKKQQVKTPRQPRIDKKFWTPEVVHEFNTWKADIRSDGVKELSVLEQANKLIYGDRQAAYGSATENMGNTAAIWSVILSKKLKEPISAEEVGWMMVGLKMSREVFKKSADNLLDAAGYIGVIDKCQKGL